MVPELIALNALKKETELHSEVVRQVEKINERHLQAYEVVKRQQYERLDKVRDHHALFGLEIKFHLKIVRASVTCL